MVFNAVGSPQFQLFETSYFNLFSFDNYTIDFGYRIDQLTSVLILAVTGIGFLIQIFSGPFMNGESKERFAIFSAFLNLLITSMLLFVMGSNLMVMFFGWAGMSLATFFLMGFKKNDNNTKSATKLFLLNLAGDMALLLGIIWILTDYHTLSISKLFYGGNALFLTLTPSEGFLTGVSILFLFSALIKSAQFPFSFWVSETVTSPVPATALIQSVTVVSAGAILLIRCSLLFSLSPTMLTFTAAIGSITLILGALIALNQNDIKKLLAFSTVSQLGFVFIGIGVGAFSQALLFAIIHAVSKTLLILSAGIFVQVSRRTKDIRKSGTIFRKLKAGFIPFLAGCVALGCIPPFSGFIAINEILNAAFAKNIFIYLISISGLILTVAYLIRIVALFFKGGNEKEIEIRYNANSSSTIVMTFFILAILALSIGWINIPEVIKPGTNYFSSFLEPVLSVSEKFVKTKSKNVGEEKILLLISAIIVLASVIFSWFYFRKQKGQEKKSRFSTLLNNAFYANRIWDAFVLRPVKKTSQFFEKTIDLKIIEGSVNGVGKAVIYSSRQFRLLQSGQLGSYVLLMVLGTVLFFVIYLFVLQ